MAFEGELPSDSKKTSRLLDRGCGEKSYGRKHEATLPFYAVTPWPFNENVAQVFHALAQRFSERASHAESRSHIKPRNCHAYYAVASFELSSMSTKKGRAPVEPAPRPGDLMQFA